MVSAALRRSSIVSNRGTTFSRATLSAASTRPASRASTRTATRSEGWRVIETIQVSTALGPKRSCASLTRSRTSSTSLLAALGRARGGSRGRRFASSAVRRRRRSSPPASAGASGGAGEGEQL